SRLERCVDQRERLIKSLIAYNRRWLRGYSRRGFSKLKLNAPAMLADFRFRPKLQGADFGELRAQFHRDKPLARFSETNYRVQRRMRVKVGNIRTRNRLAHRVVHAR